MEIDHLFICVNCAALGAELLSEAGFTEGSANHHPGQGTACRRFFFQNSYIELLALDNPDDARSELTRPALLYERFAGAGGDESPFGICFRKSPADEESGCPFPAWAYRPVYLPQHLHVDVADSGTVEPMWFFLSFGQSPDSADIQKRQPLKHKTAVSRITSVEVTLSGKSELSAAASFAMTVPGLKVRHGDSPLMVVGFDDQVKNVELDFRSKLPLIVRY